MNTLKGKAQTLRLRFMRVAKAYGLPSFFVVVFVTTIAFVALLWLYFLLRLGFLLGRVQEFSAAIQAISMVVLVIVTSAYAFYTAQMAKRTKEQAEATTRAAEAANKQAETTQELAIQAKRQSRASVQPIVRFIQPTSLQRLGIENIGLGPALNLRCWTEIRFEGGDPVRCSRDASGRFFRHPVLAVGETWGHGNGTTTWELDGKLVAQEKASVSLLAIYQNIYADRFKSETCLDPAEGSPGRRKVKVCPVQEITTEMYEELAKEAGF